MQFKDFSNLVNIQFGKMAKTGNLFVSKLSSRTLWEIYLTSFRKEDNAKFRDPNSSTHNCNHCNNFIRRYGNVVAIDRETLDIITMFDVNLPIESEYYASAKAMSKALKDSLIGEVFFETFAELNSLPYESCNKKQLTYRLGVQTNHKIYTSEEAEKFGAVKEGQVYQFNHFYADLPTEFVDKTGKSQEAIQAYHRDNAQVLLRGLSEIPIDTLELVRDLINQGSLLDGTTHLHKVNAMIELKKEFDTIPASKRVIWIWLKSHNFTFAKFRNELIGTLCVELAEGVELNEACQTWNKRVDPANYMKAKAPITKRQVEEAEKFIRENGYTESFNRRFATLRDISIEEILHASAESKSVRSASIFDSIKPSVSTRHKRSSMDKVQEIGIEKFMKDILPSSTSIEILFENRMVNNLVTLTTSEDKNSKGMFKWNNNFSWTYNGNLAGKSHIKESVKSRGGNADGALRASIMWSGDNKDNSDLDLWASEPGGRLIGFNQGFRKDSGNLRTPQSGQLDVDITNPFTYGYKDVVENIVWTDLSKMRNGTFKIWVKQFSAMNSQGFEAEIAFGNESFHYKYNRPVSDIVQIASVTLKDGNFTIQHALEESNTSKKVWGIDTESFHKANLICLSPNHWGNNNAGNKHYFFMIDGCHSDTPMRSFHNENLNSELLSQRKVTEVLANSTMLQPVKEQLAGLGFNSTVKDELLVRVSGTHKRMFKITF